MLRGNSERLARHSEGATIDFHPAPAGRVEPHAVAVVLGVDPDE
ncbi:hypothetical protein [Nonomuraea endophytica]